MKFLSVWKTWIIAVVLMGAFVFTGFSFTSGTRIERVQKAEFTINNSYKESEVFDVTNDTGIYSVHYVFNTTSTHADARVNIDLWVSPTGASGTWARSTSFYAIASAQHEGSGTDSNGIDCISFEPPLNVFFKVRFTETATQAAVLSAWIIKR